MVTMKIYNCVECDSFQRQEFTSWSFINFKITEDLNSY
jgi:hypothetical protein